MKEEGTTAALRVFDANANRASEGLRTIEDVARLVREDEFAALAIKRLRHRLADACKLVNRIDRLEARSAVDDAGTQLSTRAEESRSNWTSIVVSASERVAQSLRVLEEATKLITRDASPQFKQLRYDAYDTLAEVELKLTRARSFPVDARVYALIDCARPLADFSNYITELAEAGVGLLQIRDKTSEITKLALYVRRAVTLLADTPVPVIVNDRVDVALSCGAQGVHLGQDDLPLVDARRLAKGKLFIGISTHSIGQARQAERDGADYIGCGPVFRSETKAFTEFPGTEFLREVSEQISIPAFAIGGVHQENVREVIESGCRRVAVSHAIHASADPVASTMKLASLLR